jgi:hypothetical protein
MATFDQSSNFLESYRSFLFYLPSPVKRYFPAVHLHHSLNPSLETQRVSIFPISKRYSPTRKGQRASIYDKVKHEDWHIYQKYYLEVLASPDFQDEVKLQSATKIKEFDNNASSIINDSEMQHSRASMLLSTLANPKGPKGSQVRSIHMFFNPWPVLAEWNSKLLKHGSQQKVCREGRRIHSWNEDHNWRDERTSLDY